MDTHIVVTINREFGAEGHEIGKILSTRLGIKLYDKDILGRAAREKGATESILSRADETISEPSFDPYMMLNMGIVNRSDQLFKIEEQIIHDTAAKESCIIIGRLSDYLLRNEPYALKALVKAPFDWRVANIMRKHNMTNSEAKKMVRQMDMARKNYSEYYSNGKWKLDTEKDIILNRATLGLEGCADILEAAVNAKIYQMGQKDLWQKSSK